MIKIVTNKILCKYCGDYLESHSRHDFRQCKCGKCFTDGGTDYIHRGFDADHPADAYADLSVYYDTETGKTLTAKDIDLNDIPHEDTDPTSGDLKVERSLIPDLVEFDDEPLTPPSEQVVIHEVTEGREPEPSPLVEEVVSKVDESGKPISGRYPFNKKKAHQ